LQDQDGQPVPDQAYVVTLPNGEQVQGNLDSNGFARIAVFEDPGTCKVSFPNIASDAWQYIRSEDSSKSET
jgi:hypothetical protein